MRYLPEDLASSSTVPALRPALPAKGLMSAALSFLENVRYRAMTSDADFEFLADWRWNHFRATS